MIELTQSSMADMLGMTRQSLNTELKKLEHAGVVRITYSKIELLNLEFIRRSAGLDYIGPH